MSDPSNQNKDDNNQLSATQRLFENDPIALADKLDAFPKYISRPSMAKFLAKYEILKRVLNVHGSIIECGVLNGGGLFTWAKLSSILEPVNHLRKVIGFDTFEGFPSIDKKDSNTGTYYNLKPGGLKGNSMEEIGEAISVYDMNRPLSHIPKIELVKGDITHTASEYLRKNPYLIVSILNLNFDLYEPTKAALEIFLPRMPKGSIILFGELNAKIFPGETMAVLETIGLHNLKLERFTFDSYTSFAIVDNIVTSKGVGQQLV